MKTIKIKIKIQNAACAAAVAVLGWGAVSCNDMLDTKPQGVFTPDQLTEESATELLVSAYASLLNHYPNINGVDYGNNQAFAGPINNWVIDLRSDDAVKGGGDMTQEAYMIELELGNVQSNNASISFKWLNNYTSISRCNDAIKALAAASSLPTATRDSYIAEMKTLRAYYYFDMYRLFKEFPWIDENTVNPSEVSPREYTKDQMLGFIESDLAAAYKVLPETQPVPARFNKYVAAAILAKVALFVSDWATVEEYAGYVISSGQYSLYPNFLDLSKPEFNNQYEAILAIQFSNAQSPEQYNYNNCLNCTYSKGELYGNGDDFYLGSQDLVNAFATDEYGLPYFDGKVHEVGKATSPDVCNYEGNVDPRLDFTFGRIGFPWRGYTYDGDWVRALDYGGQYSPKKCYPSPDSPYVEVGIVPWGANSLNFSLIRYADVMLMKAEALIEQNKDLAQARTLINEIRMRAYNSVDAAYSPVDVDPNLAEYNVGQYPETGWNQDYARKAVRMERRLELAMEGHRWFDLLRWGNAVETVTAYYNYEKTIHSYYNSASLSADDLYFPIPLDQVDKSPIYK